MAAAPPDLLEDSMPSPDPLGRVRGGCRGKREREVGEESSCHSRIRSPELERKSPEMGERWVCTWGLTVGAVTVGGWLFASP
jgi:hypothetical protein